jgi:hypothetical protein
MPRPSIQAKDIPEFFFGRDDDIKRETAGMHQHPGGKD